MKTSTDKDSAVVLLREAAEKLIKWRNACGYKHDLICNFQQDSSKTCNCGYANIKTAVAALNKE